MTAPVDPTTTSAWAELTTSTFELVTFPGAHFFIHSAADVLREAVEKTLIRWFPPGT